MMTSSRFFSLPLMLSLLAAPAFADTIGQREWRQHERIAEASTASNAPASPLGRIT